MTRYCKGCERDLELTEFSFKSRTRGILHTSCRLCTRRYFRAYYARNRARYVERSRKRNLVEREHIRARILDYLTTHACVDCGEADPVVLQFDHRDPSTKWFSI